MHHDWSATVLVAAFNARASEDACAPVCADKVSAQFWREKEKTSCALGISGKRSWSMSSFQLFRWAGYLAGTVLTAASNPFDLGDLLPF